MENRPAINIPYPERVSRAAILIVLIRAIILLPQSIILGIWTYLATFCLFIMLIIAIFIARYPRGMFNFVVGNWQKSIEIGSYSSLFSSQYPPFFQSLKAESNSNNVPSINIPFPERVSRAAIIVAIIRNIRLIPQWIILGVGSIFAVICLYCMFIIAIFTGNYPRGMFNFVIGSWQKSYDIMSYLSLFSSDYPPFFGGGSVKNKELHIS